MPLILALNCLLSFGNKHNPPSVPASIDKSYTLHGIVPSKIVLSSSLTDSVCTLYFKSDVPIPSVRILKSPSSSSFIVKMSLF